MRSDEVKNDGMGGRARAAAALGPAGAAAAGAGPADTGAAVSIECSRELLVMNLASSSGFRYGFLCRFLCGLVYNFLLLDQITEHRLQVVVG
jgi:hypothetical protein